MSSEKYAHNSAVLMLHLFFLVYSGSGNAQIENPIQSDSLYKILHVKARITDTDDYFPISSYKEEFFDKNGHIIKSLEYAKAFNNTLHLEETYVYDSLGQLLQKSSKGLFSPNFQEEFVTSLLSLFEYDKEGHLKEEMIYDSTGRLRRENVYDYKNGKVTWYYFDLLNKRITFSQKFFDSQKNVYKSCENFKNGDTEKSCSIWDVEYDKKGRIKKKILMLNKKKEIEIWYSYKPNGLLGSIKRIGGSFSPSKIEFHYEYWK